MFIRRISLFAGALLMSAVPAMAQDHSAHTKADTKLIKGGSIAIEGCVTPGENKDTFVLAAVKEIPGRPIETGLLRVYRLNDIGKFRGMAGQVVRVEGRIDGIEEGEIDPKPGEAKDGGLLVEFEVPGRDVDTTAAVMRAGGASGTAKVKTTVIKIDVDKVTAVRACGS